MPQLSVPFNKPHLTGRESEYLAEAMASGQLEGDGPFTRKCQAWLEEWSGAPLALMTHSCTAALDMSALLLDIQPGDEVIMPSYTFVSTANAFVLRGGVPVFVDIRPDTLNLDETLVEAAITPRTRAFVAVHYAGVACEMDALLEIAGRHSLPIVEDAAQGIMASYKGRALGAIGQLGALSFHATKNIVSGEGGALLVNDSQMTGRAEIIREKGTDRNRFIRGEVDKYTWQEIGSSYLPSELNTAFLLAQLEAAQEITGNRLELWQTYHGALEDLEQRCKLQRPAVPRECIHNGHMYYVVLSDEFDREQVLSRLREQEIIAASHYMPLHAAPAGSKYGRAHGPLPVTERVAERIVRLPLWAHLSGSAVETVVSALHRVLSGK